MFLIQLCVTKRGLAPIWFFSYLTSKNVLPYFPFTESFSQKMGTTPLPRPDCFIERDDYYHADIALKHKLLTDDYDYYFAALPGSEQAQWEVLNGVLTSLNRTAPEAFLLAQNHDSIHWTNRLLGETAAFTRGASDTLPGAGNALDWVGRQVQEDLLILDPNGILVAGQLCFPSGWSLHEKLGKNFMDIHGPLPQTLAPMLKAADMLMTRLPAGKPLQRNNWGLRVTDQADLSSRHAAAYREQLHETASILTPQNAGDQIYIRIEHQTLMRLPDTHYILFTIHTYQSLVSQEITSAQRAHQFLTFLETVPAAVADYKLITLLLPSLMAYLKRRM